MKTLIAGPWHGSLHAELLCWQGWLRRMAKAYNRVIVVADPDRKAIYADFASVVVSPASEPLVLGADRVTAASVPVRWIGHIPVVDNQEFLLPGDLPGLEYHAVIDAHEHSHLRRADWAQISCQFGTDMDLAWASDGLTQGITIGGTDIRNASYDRLVEAVRASRMVIAPMGGLSAIATLNGVPLITWIGKDSPNLYANIWSPHGSPVIVFRGNPTAPQIADAVGKIAEFYSAAHEEEFTESD